MFTYMNQDMQIAAAVASSAIGSTVLWVLFGYEAGCKDPVENLLTPESPCEKVTVLGITPIFGSQEEAAVAAFLLAGVIIVIAVFHAAVTKS